MTEPKLCPPELPSGTTCVATCRSFVSDSAPGRGSESLVNVCQQEQVAFPPWARRFETLTATGRGTRWIQRHNTETPQIVIALLPARSSSTFSIPGTEPGSHLDHVAATATRLVPAEDAPCPATPRVWPRRPGPGR